MASCQWDIPSLNYVIGCFRNRLFRSSLLWSTSFNDSNKCACDLPLNPPLNMSMIFGSGLKVKDQDEFEGGHSLTDENIVYQGGA